MIRNYDASKGTNEDNLYNLTTTYAYNADGRLVSTTDPAGRVSHSQYNNLGQLVTQIENYDATKAQNADGLYSWIFGY